MRFSKLGVVFYTLCILTVCLVLDLIHNISGTSRHFGSNRNMFTSIEPLAIVKPGRKWIVVTSISSPTEDVKRLASFQDWNLVVVADTKTPLDWTLDGVHLLSVEYQKSLPFNLVSSLPYKSYTRKNIGYLYAISQGAEWIYDTDDDNKPYDKLGLEQFEYEDSVSGIRYQAPKDKSVGIKQRLFNPYRYFGMKNMWPRGFPLEYFEEHTNGNDTQVLCKTMKRAAVQQGLVHHDPDVDAIYRLLHADSNTGLNVKFNKFTPPITLSVGTYSPWNSQNTLFHKSAFHTLFLPTTVSFRTTDIWRSFISQKILHLSGLTVSFVPTNAVQYRNAHDYLKDFKDEKQVYEDSGKMIKYLHSWNCPYGNLKECMTQLANDLVDEQLWGSEDSQLLVTFLDDLEQMGYEFPLLVGPQTIDPYEASTNETTRDVNCRRMSLVFELVDPQEEGSDETMNMKRAVQKLNYFGDIVDWCNASGYDELSQSFPSPEQVAESHNENYVLQRELDTVLVVVNNYPWKYGMGLLQRLYQPYFATTIFCGPWYPKNVTNADDYTSTIHPFNYIHINPAEMHRGYFAYHCMTLVKEMRLSNVKGYFLMADDAFFNIWQRIDYDRVHHLQGVTYSNETIWWGIKEFGLSRAKRIVQKMKKTEDTKVLETWKRFEDGLKQFKYIRENETAEKDMTQGRGRSVSDFYYIPASEIDYYGSLMRIFYENKLFLEIAMNRFLRSVNHQTPSMTNSSYLWKNRKDYLTIYHRDMVAMHPVKVSQFKEPTEERKKYCNVFMQTWSDILFGGSQNYTVKADDAPDYLNG